MIRVRVTVVAGADDITVSQEAVRVLRNPSEAELGDAILNPTKTVVCPDEETAERIRGELAEIDDVEVLEPEPEPLDHPAPAIAERLDAPPAEPLVPPADVEVPE